MYHVKDERVVFVFRFPSGMPSRYFDTSDEAFDAAECAGQFGPVVVERHVINTITKVNQ